MLVIFEDPVLLVGIPIRKVGWVDSVRVVGLPWRSGAVVATLGGHDATQIGVGAPLRASQSLLMARFLNLGDGLRDAADPYKQ